MDIQLEMAAPGALGPAITAKRFLPPAKPSRWSPELLAKMEAPIEEGNRFLALALAGRNVFLTGMAGTGKSTLLREFIARYPGRVSVTAPTGVAALNVGGMTLHRFCGMRLGPKPGQSDEEFYDELLGEKHPAVMAGFRRVQRCQVLVIDEVSMLPGRILSFVDFLFSGAAGVRRAVRRVPGDRDGRLSAIAAGADFGQGAA